MTQHVNQFHSPQILTSRIVTRLRALVVLPTRDLVQQVRETFEACCKGTKLKVTVPLDYPTKVLTVSLDRHGHRPAFLRPRTESNSERHYHCVRALFFCFVVLILFPGYKAVQARLIS